MLIVGVIVILVSIHAAAGEDDIADAGLQRLLQLCGNSLLLLRADGPQAQRASEPFPAGMGVRHIKDIAQAGPAAPGVNQGDTVCAPVDPAAHPVIPKGQFGASRGVWSLTKNQKLV